MTEERDVMLEQIVSALRPLPAVDEGAKARVLIAVAAEREREREQAARQQARRRGRWRWAGVGGALAAAALLAVVVPRSTPVATVAPVAVTPPVVSTEAQLATRDLETEANAARQTVQLVFKAPTASSVRVVGDFNSWDGERAPMVRDPETGLWSATLQLRPGRHVYAYVVDDSIWVRDPRAPSAKDADFGRPGSVLLVGRP